MYTPHNYQPLDQKIIFTYSSILKPLTNKLFIVFLAVLFIIFIIATTIMLFEGKLIRVEEENKKLENTVKERTKELEAEKNRSENLLLNILPKEIAKELTAHPERTIAKEYPNVTVLFTDIVGFTKISGEMTAEEVVTMLNKMFTMFDERAKREGIEKIKTIGDAYMAAAGLTEEEYNDGALKMMRFANGLLEDVKTFNENSNIKLMIRLGVNSGPVVAGVIGKTKFIYDIWGDTVNVASRMESTGEPMKIHVTETTYLQTKDFFTYSEGINVEVKGKGQMKTYFL
jgi:class 3 adenylate cyclase